MGGRGPGRPPKRGRVFRNHAESKRHQRNCATESRDAEKLETLNSFRDPTIACQTFDETSIPKFSIGDMNVKCDFCSALHFKSELVNGHFNNCCHNGLIKLPEPKVHEDLKNLFLTDRDFMNNIRNYNSAFAFASFSASRQDIPGRGPYCFKIQGQIYR